MKHKLRTTVKGHGGFATSSFRDVGKLGYGSGGAADSPWARQGIFVMSSQGVKDYAPAGTGGPGLPLERRDRVENPMLKTIHEFVEANWLCLHCNMLEVGHDRLMEKLKCSKR